MGRRKNIISAIFTIVILLMGTLGFQFLKSQKKSTVSNNTVKKERRKVKYTNFQKGEEKNIIELDGRLQAHERVAITSKVQGVMQSTGRSVREGKYFKKGDVLFSVDKKEAGYNLNAQKSSLMTAITQMMPDLKFDYPLAFPNWEKYLNEFSLDAPIKPLPEPIDKQEKYFVAGKNIYSQYFNIKSQETRMTDYTIYAPFSGVITSASVFPGALISPGQSLATMINTNRYEISSPVPLENLKYISVGQKVKLTSNELNKSWTGTVNRIGTQLDNATQNLPVYISVSGKGLKDGIYLKGELEGNILSDVSKLPKDVFVTPNSLYIIEDSTIVKKEISTIKRTSNHVIVKGLNSNEKVISGSMAGLFEGQKVNY